VIAEVDLKTVLELMRHPTKGPGWVSVQSGWKLADNANKAGRASKLNSPQFIESK
jgi:hypothetical protein